MKPGSNAPQKIISRGEEKHFLKNIVSILKKNRLDGIGKIESCFKERFILNFIIKISIIELDWECLGKKGTISEDNKNLLTKILKVFFLNNG